MLCGRVCGQNDIEENATDVLFIKRVRYSDAHGGEHVHVMVPWQYKVTDRDTRGLYIDG